MSKTDLTYEERQHYHNIWFNNRLIHTDLLNIWEADHKTTLLHDMLEEKIVKDLEHFIGFPKHGTSGNSPEYDILTSRNLKIEVKSSARYDHTHGREKPIFIECSKGPDRVPSGLSVSEADFYITLQLAPYKGGLQMKVRIMHTSLLREIAKDSDTVKVNDSYGFYVYPKKLAVDGWVGHYPYDHSTQLLNLQKFGPATSQYTDRVSSMIAKYTQENK